GAPTAASPRPGAVPVREAPGGLRLLGGARPPQGAGARPGAGRVRRPARELPLPGPQRRGQDAPPPGGGPRLLPAWLPGALPHRRHTGERVGTGSAGVALAQAPGATPPLRPHPRRRGGLLTVLADRGGVALSVLLGPLRTRERGDYLEPRLRALDGGVRS